MRAHVLRLQDSLFLEITIRSLTAVLYQKYEIDINRFNTLSFNIFKEYMHILNHLGESHLARPHIKCIERKLFCSVYVQRLHR